MLPGSSAKRRKSAAQCARRPRRLARSLLALLCFAATAGCGASRDPRPDLVLITLDALRADLLACYGGDRELGIELCALGESGARYVWAFAAAVASAPSAASLLSSLHPAEHGVRSSAASFLPARVETLAERLRAAGYATAAFVESPELNRSRHFQQGFDLYDDRTAAARAGGAASPAEALASWSERQQRPWFAWIHLDSPRLEGAGGGRPGDRQRRSEAALRRLDRRLSQLIAVLDSEPGEPAMLVTALRGDAPGRSGGAEDVTSPLALARIRVPLLWRPPHSGPGRTVGRSVTTPVSLLDVMPTLLESAGVATSGTTRGTRLPFGDLPPEAEAPGSRAIFAEHPDSIAVVAGAEYASRARRHALAPIRTCTARLWPRAEPLSEVLPPCDRPGEQAQRAARLEPLLGAFEQSAPAPAAVGLRPLSVPD